MGRRKKFEHDLYGLKDGRRKKFEHDLYGLKDGRIKRIDNPVHPVINEIVVRQFNV